MLNHALRLIAITLIPALELRASIPYGIIAYKMSFITVFLICTIANFILGIAVYLVLKIIITLLRKNPALSRLYDKLVTRAQKKIEKYVQKYGEIGVAIFIGIPLPMSGVYTGALGSFAIGLGFKKFIIADLIGVTIAGVIVTLASLTGAEFLTIFLKHIS